MLLSFFSQPQTIDARQLDEIITAKKQKTSSFTRFCPERSHRLGLHAGQFYCVTKISDDLHTKLSQTYTYLTMPSNHPRFPHTIMIGNTPPDACEPPDEETESGIALSYYVGETLPLVYDEATNKPQAITDVDAFAAMIAGKKTVLYTGAGISYGAVPTMQELMSLIQLDKEKNIDGLLMSVLTDSGAMERRWTSFFDRMTHAAPSQAHYAVTRFCLAHSVQLFTENLDLLHQRAGIVPLVPEGPGFEKKLDVEEIRQLDYVITVGLSKDDRGLLAYLRKNNPQMQIISLNPNCVSYCGSQDYWFAEDCQKVLPLIV